MTSVTGVSAPDPSPTSSVASRSTGRLGDRVFSGLSIGAGTLVVVLVLLIGLFLVTQAVPALQRNEVNFLTSSEWTVSGEHPRFGVAGLLWVTVVSSIIAMLLAVPVGVAVALFLTQYAPTWLARPAAGTIDLLAAVPSIVYGLWGLRQFGPVLVPVQQFFAQYFGWIPIFAPNNGLSGNVSTIFVVGVVLAIMILPIVTALSREVFAQTPRAHIEGAMALGATKWETIRTAVLPFGKPGVISAAMLGLGRALGETLAVTIILATLAPGTPWVASLFNGGETFASKIANNAGEFDTPQKTGAFLAAGLVLFLLTFVVNAIARIVIERRKAFSE
ncbi:phosphate ABC transporter permease subunit PstC [Agilicoccus flavus]|uniref:phosphate ABC transporter permease subunit PstC n=1 Tax=Agilicoccus flavus TaxID=2775968 RepID=UPI001CF60873|nr:phosphate ABC transporter permease subunit PstC [Agilicoccus flavus]